MGTRPKLVLIWGILLQSPAAFRNLNTLDVCCTKFSNTSLKGNLFWGAGKASARKSFLPCPTRQQAAVKFHAGGFANATICDSQPWWIGATPRKTTNLASSSQYFDKFLDMLGQPFPQGLDYSSIPLKHSELLKSSTVCVAHIKEPGFCSFQFQDKRRLFLVSFCWGGADFVQPLIGKPSHLGNGPERTTGVPAVADQ